LTHYVLITAARNEEAFIHKTILAVVRQTVLPRRWIIINDGSVDQTAKILKEHAQKYSFINILTTTNVTEQDFSSKVRAINSGYCTLKDVDYDFIGILDADISPEQRYYEKIIDKITNNRKLGICGGTRYDLFDSKFHRVPTPRHTIGGGYQVFQRQCFEKIGGFIPLQKGGEDVVAEIMARRVGFEVESFPEIHVFHYRPTGGASNHTWRKAFDMGLRDYFIGYHPLFAAVKCIYRMKRRPYIWGSVIAFSAYIYATLHSLKSPVPKAAIEHVRAHQKKRLRLSNILQELRYFHQHR
jgi:glycosyltransferase involved in cell wall biosynthesis